jgi:hypothetical protein
MKIFYYSKIRWTALFAGFIHLERLALTSSPSMAEILAIVEKYQGALSPLGTPYLVGVDSFQNQIYAIGFGSQSNLGLQTIFGIINQDSDPAAWKFIPVPIRYDWVFSKPFHFNLAVKMLFECKRWEAIWIWQVYQRLTDLVTQVKAGEQFGKTQSSCDY